MYSLLRSVAGSSSSSFSSPNFLDFSQVVGKDRSRLPEIDHFDHFSVSQPTALHSSARGYFSKLRRATYPEESHLSPFSPPEFLVAVTNLFVHCQWPRQSCLFRAKAPSLLRRGFSPAHFQCFLVFAFLSFHLEDIFHYSHTQDGKTGAMVQWLGRPLRSR